MYTLAGGQNKPRNLAHPIYLNGRCVGQVRAGVFSKSAHASKHFLRRPKAICYDRCVLVDAEAAGARLLLVRDQESGRVYSTPLATFWAHCFEVHRGFGAQVGLGLDHWSIDGAPAAAEQRAAATNQEVKALQPGLFGEAR